VILNSLTAKQATEKELAESAEYVKRRVEDYEKLITLAEERQYIDAFKNAWREYLSTSQTVLDLSRQARADEVEALYSGESRNRFEAAVSILEQISDLSDKEANESGDRSIAISQNARISIILVLVITI